MAHHWPKESYWHCTVLSLGQMTQLIMIILSLTALTLYGAHIKNSMYICKINYSVLYSVCYCYNYVPLFVLCCVYDVLHAVRAS